MVLANNPAGLAELRGAQFLANFNLALLDACVEPIGFYGWGAYRGGVPSELQDPETGETLELNIGDPAQIGPDEEAYYNDTLDTVCLEQALQIVPQFVWALRISERVGVGAGLIFPAAQPTGQWGGQNGVIRGDDNDLRPSPLRYMQLQTSLIGAFPTVGAGVRLMDEIRLGLALQWGMVGVVQRLMTASGGGTSPSGDIITEIHGEDFFIPSFTVSTHIVPIDEIDLVLAFKWQDELDAGGEIDLTTGVFHPRLNTHHNEDLEVESLRQAMPWKLTGGIRYAYRLAPRPKGTGGEEADPALGDAIHDPLTDELWDIELDVEYQFNSLVESQQITFASGQTLAFEDLDGNVDEIPYFESPNSMVELKKNWQDQVSVRLGGSYNVLRGVLAVNAGAHYENRGVDPSYMQTDFWPVERVGMHVGVVFRIQRSTDLTLSYAHFFQESIVVAPPPHGDRTQGEFDKTVGTQITRGEELPVLEEDPVEDPDGTAAYPQVIMATTESDPAWINNAGTYHSHFDVISAGVNLHF